MNDDRLRALERRWQETGSSEDELAWDQERSRQGLLLRVIVVQQSVRPPEPLDEATSLEEAPGFKSVSSVLRETQGRPHAPWIVWDFSGVDEVPSSLAGQLVAVGFNLKDLGGGVVACGLGADLAEALGWTGVEIAAPTASRVGCLSARRWEQRGPAIAIEHVSDA